MTELDGEKWSVAYVPLGATRHMQVLFVVIHTYIPTLEAGVLAY